MTSKHIHEIPITVYISSDDITENILISIIILSFFTFQEIKSVKKNS